MTSLKLAAGAPFPAFDVSLLNGGRRTLTKPKQAFEWMLIVIYRGKHCPLCTKYLKELNAVLPELNKIGIDALAISADDSDKAEAQMVDVMPEFDVGYGLTIEHMQMLGLYVSSPRNGMNVGAPFAEPALFVINNAGNLQVADVSSVPFARPDLQSMVKGLAFLRGLTQDFPVSGSYL